LSIKYSILEIKQKVKIKKTHKFDKVIDK
jgi:hypothetical protein